MPNVLGLSAYFHDSAACLVRDGEIVGAIQEERESRLKHDEAFPELASRALLQMAGLKPEQLDLVVFYEIPYLHAERVLHSQIRFAPRGWRAFPRAIRSLLSGKIWVEQAIAEQLGFEGEVLFVPHHWAHAASAYLPSPFDEAAVLTVDGVGEWATTQLAHGRGGELRVLEEQHFPHSLGLFYAAMTAWCGFRVNSGEYKLMGLAPYGKPRFVDALRREVIHVAEDGSIRLNMRHFDFPAGLEMGRASLGAVLDGPARSEGAPLTEREADLAASTQVIIEDAMRAMARHARQRTGARHLCLAGGVALNCVAVGKLIDEGLFDDVWVQPAAGDAGGALGAALLGARELVPGSRPSRANGSDAMRGALLGPAPDTETIRRALDSYGLQYEAQADAALDETVAEALANGAVVGWFQGPMEFGPRALGARSILADPRRPEMKARVNRDMKLREAFRPFAPAVIEEEAGRYFAIERPAPYMTRTARVRDFQGAQAAPSPGRFDDWQVQSSMPATTHVDGTARLQTVSRTQHPRFHALLRAFQKRSDLPVLLNTSFNLRGEPLVSSPADAIRTFAHSALDLLAMGPFVIRRSEQRAGTLERIDAPRRTED